MHEPYATPKEALKTFWSIYGPAILQGLACLAFYASGLVLLYALACL